MAKCPVCQTRTVTTVAEICDWCVRHMALCIADEANLAGIINGCRRGDSTALDQARIAVRTVQARRTLVKQYQDTTPTERAEFLFRYNCREVLRWTYPLLGQVRAADVRRWKKELKPLKGEEK